MEIKQKWDLAKYFYDSIGDKRFIDDVALIEVKVNEFVSKYQGKIMTFSSASQFIEYYDDNEYLDKLITKPYLFVNYLNALDTQDTNVIKKLQEMYNLVIRMQSMLLFISQEFKQLGYDAIMSIADSLDIGKYRNALVHEAESIKYVLEEKQEFVLNTKKRPLSMLDNLENELRNSFMFDMEIDGLIENLTEEEVRSYRSDKNENIRKSAYKALRSVYNDKQNQICLGNIYSGIVKDRITNIELRGYNSVMEPRNISEQLENEVVDMLLEQVRMSYPIFQRYIDIKRRFMGKDEFYIWDLQAPIYDIDSKFTIDQALDLHLDSMKAFDDEFYQYSIDMFEKGRVDVMPAQGKRGGAFCSYSKGSDSFVLLNFTGTIRDVATISHELGHAIHGNYAQGNPACVYDSPLSLAETASIFNEMLLSDNLKKKLSDKEKIEFLNKKLEDVFATIFRQVQYVSFERIVHQELLKGNELTYVEFNNLRRQSQLEMSGDKIIYDVPPENECGWSMIPHIFHTPFYCYAYAFGNLLTFSLFNQYVIKGKDFINDYKDILRSGGSLRPKDLLSKYGIDITSKDFYQGGISEIKKMVDEFEGLL